MYAFDTGEWTQVEDYPYGEEWISAYEMIYILEASSYVVIGGTSRVVGLPGYLSQIARFSVLGSPPFASGTWCDAGRLNHARGVSSRSLSLLPKKLNHLKRHGALWFDNTLVVAGGLSDTLSTDSESCRFDQSASVLKCVDIKPELEEHYAAASFLVPFDYCT